MLWKCVLAGAATILIWITWEDIYVNYGLGLKWFWCQIIGHNGTMTSTGGWFCIRCEEVWPPIPCGCEKDNHVSDFCDQ